MSKLDELGGLEAAKRLVSNPQYKNHVWGDDYLQALIERVEELERDLAECYRLSGADPDGNEDWRLAKNAVCEVKRLREESDAEFERYDAKLQSYRELAEMVVKKSWNAGWDDVIEASRKLLGLPPLEHL